MRHVRRAGICGWVMVQVGCAAPAGGPTDRTPDADLEDTDEADVEHTDGGDTEVTEDTEDTEDTDPAPTTCTLAPFPSATMLTDGPSVGDIVTAAYFVEVCANATSWTGQHVYTFAAASGDLYCTFRVPMRSEVPTDDCEGCLHAFNQIAFSDAEASDAELCAVMGVDTAWLEGWEQLFSQSAMRRQGVASASDELLFDAGLNEWIPQHTDPMGRTRTQFGDTTHLRLDQLYWTSAWE